MAEEVREIQIAIVVHTNKRTYTEILRPTSLYNITSDVAEWVKNFLDNYNQVEEEYD